MRMSVPTRERGFILGLLAFLWIGCSTVASAAGPAPGPDLHSYSQPDSAALRHLELDVRVDFNAHRLWCRAELSVDHGERVTRLLLDTDDLDIRRVTLEPGGHPARYRLAPEQPVLGSALIVQLRADTRVVRVDYASAPDAAALLWLDPAQTAGGRQPFLFSQNQTRFARSWIPCQDSPGVRFTYDAVVHVPPGLMAVMSAGNPQSVSTDGLYRFHMGQPVPAYLVALAVGNLAFQSLGARTGVYAEPSQLKRAAWEFADLEAMMREAERLYGPYRWGRYDILVLPPYFPFGGMENPRLTFATPTILTGDRSLVSLVAHELAHSWSGNLVTNRSWGDFWINEGTSMYLERRIMEALHGRDYAEMLAELGWQDLQDAVAALGPDDRDTRLHLDLRRRDPEDALGDVAYEKGYAFLRRVEEVTGRQRFDGFLRGYFDEFAFQSMDAATFSGLLHQRLLDGTAAADSLDLQEWIYGTGIPADCPRPHSRAFAAVDRQLEAWKAGAPAAELDVLDWDTHQWCHFLRGLGPADARVLAELDAALRLTQSPNAEIFSLWAQRSVDAWYEPAFGAMERFLRSMGRGKFLEPIYTELAHSERGRRLARRIYGEARPHYHPISTRVLDDVLGWRDTGR